MALNIWLPPPQEKDEVLFRRVDVKLAVEHGKDLGTMIRGMADQLQQDLPSWIGAIYRAAWNLIGNGLIQSRLVARMHAR